MGLTKTENAPGLSFEVDNPRSHYSPGDVISGQVLLNTAEDSAIGQISVNLWGRTKSRIIQQHGQAVTYHRGRTQLFNLEKTLYEGQYTHKPGSFSWPFEFTVPDRADPAAILACEKWKPKEHFTGTTDEDNLNLTLPASNHHSRIMFGRQAECFVEYVLSVTVKEPEGLHHIRKAQTKQSTLPIIYHPLSTPEPIQDWKHVLDSRNITISTLKLLPEHEGTSLGIRDRARSLFQRSSIPKFSFSLQVQAPTVIQLFHPTPIPFLVTATSDLSPENTTIDTSHGLPEVILRTATIELKTQVRCRASGTFSDSKSYTIPMMTKKALSHKLKVSDKSAEMSLGSGDETLDLGPLCELRLGNANLGSKLEAPLCPSFNTYNIAREYHLTWELEVECAGKVEKFSSHKNGSPCQVITPAATTKTTFPSIKDTELLGAELAQAQTAQSTGSSGFWQRGRSSGETADAARTGTSSTPRGEKEKPRFTPVGSSDTRTMKSKTKKQEAAEDRARARAEEAGVGDSEFHNPYENPFDGSINDSSTTQADARLSPGTGVASLPRVAVPPPSGVEDGNQLPRYVP